MNSLSEYKYQLDSLLKNYKYKNDIVLKSTDIVDELHIRMDNQEFIYKMYDIFCALEDTDNIHVKEYLCNIDKLIKCDTYDLNPIYNEHIKNKIKTINSVIEGKKETYVTHFTCNRCKENKTNIAFIHKHIGLDEASTMKITCINCNHSWYSG